jgi:hypothetical protein
MYSAHAQCYASYTLAVAGRQWVGCEELVRRGVRKRPDRSWHSVSR